MTRLTLAGYQETTLLYAGTRTLVYRGIRDCDLQPVTIKVLRNPHPNFQELVQFRNQYVITCNLEHPAIVQPLALEPYQNGYALVMPDEGAIALSDYWQQSNPSLIEFLHLGIQLAEALHYLTQQRIIHKDIKPANLLIDPLTGQVKVIDFSISSLLSKEQQQLINPNVLEGTLAYISPEQTGRMNRGIDYRTDFYSLGVTFFELLTGQLPFPTDDPMALVHCHIAQSVEFPNPTQVPSMVQAIVIKLMAKNAEDRYQSALGLKHDLEQCLEQLKATGEITPFEIGVGDRGDRFLIPEKLYGRESEVQTLLDAFDRVAQGASEIMLVAGFSGVGKTAAVNEVHKPIVKQRGYFIKGKFDQFNYNIPFSAFVQAFRDLIRQLLGSCNAELASWKAKILEAVGENGQVIIEVIPELESILGEQPPVPELSGSAAQNRFNLMFGNFVRVFATKAHPLVIFLDDLQWSDSASLNLLKLLMEESETGYLLILGAYRDNEVFPAHPLILTLNELQKQGAIVNTLDLRALSQEHITRLVADTLLCPPTVAAPIAQLVYQKTQGNPFFTTQFLLMLHEEGGIAFDVDRLYWTCDLVRVRQLALTDNVVEFMVKRLQKLPAETQDVLKLAACIGNRFDLATLAIVCEASQDEVATNLWRSLQEGFVVPESETYKFFQGNEGEVKSIVDVTAGYRFLHDRVQQAAYSLIPDERKQSTHYQIGQLLLQQIPSEARIDRSFEIVGQLNYGASLITDPLQRDELAELNLIACRKARAATAYQAAREYARNGLELLGENAWQRQYKITLEFYELAAELASICGDFPEMESLANQIIANSSSVQDKIKIFIIKIQASASQNRLKEAIEIGQQILEELGIKFPKAPSSVDIHQAIQEIEQLTENREISDLVDLPLMTDENKLAIIQVSNSILPAAFNCGSPLFSLLIALSVKLSIQYGNTSASAYSYSCYAIILCTLLQAIPTATKYGNLAINLVAKLNATHIKSQVLPVVGIFILHRTSPMKATLNISQEGYKTGLEVGNLEFAGYSAYSFCLNSFMCGQPLTDLEEEIHAYCKSLLQFNQLTTANYCRIYWQASLNLLNVNSSLSVLSGEAFQEQKIIPLMMDSHDLFGLFLLFLYKIMLGYLFNEIESNLQWGVQIRQYLGQGIGTGTVGEPVFYLYDSLTALANLNPASEEASEAWDRVEKNQTQLQTYWARYAPMNHQHKVDLVEAEKCRVLGQKAEAIERYDQAIAGAKANEYTQEEALANELAAKFYLNWGKEKIATTYMIDAYYGYARWGAKAKTDQLEQTYPQLLAPILQPENPLSDSPHSLTSSIQSVGSATSNTSILDLNSVIKSSQALSEEIELEVLLSKLMHIVIENAGADKGVFILFKDGNLTIEAAVEAGRELSVLGSVSLNSSQQIPTSLVYYVARTKESVVFSDPAQQQMFAMDSYIVEHQPKSVLCNPILDRGKLIGILYLENNLTLDAFTPERLELLKILSAQAAISIENALLYQTLEQKVEERTAQLASANQEIMLLNQRLKGENLRMSAELEVTRRLQQMMLPKEEELREIIGLDISGFMEPADEIGGDYYDVLPHDNGVQIAIGDVTGHGLESGLLMIMAQMAVRTLLECKDIDSQRFLEIINRAIYKNVQRMDVDKNMTLALLDYSQGRFILRGQHEEAIVVRCGGAIERVDTIDLGFPIGLVSDITGWVSPMEVDLKSGDAIVLYTDGITEAKNINKVQYGLERLCEVVSNSWNLSANEIRQAVIDDLREHIGAQKVYDDITILVIKPVEVTEGEELTGNING